jgi:hypothetical protein
MISRIGAAPGEEPIVLALRILVALRLPAECFWLGSNIAHDLA